MILIQDKYHDFNIIKSRDEEKNVRMKEKRKKKGRNDKKEEINLFILAFCRMMSLFFRCASQCFQF